MANSQPKFTMERRNFSHPWSFPRSFRYLNFFFVPRWVEKKPINSTDDRLGEAYRPETLYLNYRADMPRPTAIQRRASFSGPLRNEPWTNVQQKGRITLERDGFDSNYEAIEAGVLDKFPPLHVGIRLPAKDKCSGDNIRTYFINLSERSDGTHTAMAKMPPKVAGDMGNRLRKVFEDFGAKFKGAVMSPAASSDESSTEESSSDDSGDSDFSEPREKNPRRTVFGSGWD